MPSTIAWDPVLSPRHKALLCEVERAGGNTPEGALLENDALAPTIADTPEAVERLILQLVRHGYLALVYVGRQRYLRLIGYPERPEVVR